MLLYCGLNVVEGAFGRQQKMRDMGVDKLFQSLLMYSDPNLTEVYVYQVLCSPWTPMVLDDNWAL